jgi:hypothetical protein
MRDSINEFYICSSTFTCTFCALAKLIFMLLNAIFPLINTCFLYLSHFPLLSNITPKYLISLTISVSFPSSHHFSSLLNFPPFLNTNTFVSSTFIFSPHSSQKSFTQFIARCRPILVVAPTAKSSAKSSPTTCLWFITGG